MRVVQSAPTPEGPIQILEDARLTPALARLFARGGVDPALALPHDDPAALAFQASPLRPARLRQIGAGGRVVIDTVPDPAAPLARIERRRLGLKSGPVYLVTTDNDAGFGSYSGHATALYTLNDGRLGPVLAAAADGGRHAVVLSDTLKSRWRIIDSRPTHTVIEQIFCRPDFDHERPGQDQPFLLTFMTYQFDGRSWRMAERVRNGFWESDDPWPPAADFPRMAILRDRQRARSAPDPPAVRNPR